ncbi:MAG: hypothetical protein CJBNEKGG_01024 [Prosthecobacter sp.]|nr:hypothetical protein [Prosthecobacter sp.]
MLMVRPLSGVHSQSYFQRQMHAKRAIAYTVHGIATWAIFFILGSTLIATDAFHWLPAFDPWRRIGLVLFLGCCVVLTLQTYSALCLFRAFTAHAREKNPWQALLVSLLGWAINFGIGSQGVAMGLFALVGDLPTRDD